MPLPKPLITVQNLFVGFLDNPQSKQRLEVTAALCTVLGVLIGALSFALAPVLRAMFSDSDLSGSWTFEDTAGQSSFHDYTGHRFGFYVELTQNGDSILGVGRKISYDGRDVAPNECSFISVFGVQRGSLFDAALTEQISGKKIFTNFSLKMDHDRRGKNFLSGDFTSNSGAMVGTSVWRRSENSGTPFCEAVRDAKS